MCTAPVAILEEMAPRFLRKILAYSYGHHRTRIYFIDAFCSLSTELINTNPAKCCCVCPCIVPAKFVPKCFSTFRKLKPQDFIACFCDYGSH